MGVLFRIRQLVILVAFAIVGILIFNSLTISGSHEQVDVTEVDNKLEDNPVKVIIEHSDSSRGGATRATSTTFKSGKCNIPKLDINEKEVVGFFKEYPPLKCQKEIPENEKNWVRIDEKGTIRFLESRVKANCTAQFFKRKDDNNNDYTPWVNIADGGKMLNDFAIVHCKQSFESWKGLLMTVVRDEKAAEEAKNLGGNKEQMNVFFLGIDSLSQMTYRRKLPKTVKVLEELLEATVLNGYNIVGDGTPQAFIPILTAQTEVELPLTRKRFPSASYVDDVYPFIWRNFSDAGYVTCYGEDAFGIGTFTYRLKGFRNQPTTHYTRTFFKESEKLPDWDCIGSQPLYEMWYQYGKRFMEVYEDVPRFMLLHQSLLSHDDINKVGVEDDYLSSFLTEMYETGAFDNSLVILMADHGHRFSKLRDTHQGQLEERLPFFSLALPKAFRKTEKGAIMQKNLQDNKDRLVVPFDIHETLLDILNMPSVDELNSEQPLTRRSQSLFRKIKEERTCEQAGVEPHWCTCLDWKDAMNETVLVHRIAGAIVSAFNKETQAERELCAELKLDKVFSAKKLSSNKDLLAYKNVKDADGFVPDLGGTTKEEFAYYQIKLRTTPGNAVYENTALYEPSTNTLKLDFSAVSHVNKYGDTPHCIVDKNFFLASYCVCYDRIN